MKDDIRLIYKVLVQSMGAYCLVVSAASFGTVPQLKLVNGPWQSQILAVLMGFALAGVILARRPVWLVRPRNDASGGAALATLLVATIVAITLGTNLAYALAHGSGAYGAIALAASIPPLLLGFALAVVTPLHTVANYLTSRSFYSGRVIRHDTYVRRIAHWPMVEAVISHASDEDTEALA